MLSRRTLLLAPVALAPALVPWPLQAKPRALWPGSRYTEADRAKAIRGGMRFLHGTAMNAVHFAEHGDDLLWCFYTISVTAADPWLKARAWQIGVERARYWRRKNAIVPADADADGIATLVSGSLAADRLGIRNDGIKDELRQAALRFRTEEFLQFDPAKEPVPHDVPETCETCKDANARGVRTCRTCGTALTMTNPYSLLCDALVTTYFGDTYGVRLGASFSDVTRLLPRMRPYRGYESVSKEDFIGTVYAVTHIVYTFNDYNAYRLRPEWLREEYEFLRTNLRHMIALNDPETMGEFLDTLKSFGLTQNDPLIRAGMEFILSRQDADGSWGDASDRDVYHRYHSTWTAINGLMDYAWQGERVSFPEALQRAQVGW
jgi:hypothetical protein